MTKFINIVKSFTADESGTHAAEYAVMLVLITIGIILAVVFLAEEIEAGIDRVASCLQNADTLTSNSTTC